MELQTSSLLESSAKDSSQSSKKLPDPSEPIKEFEDILNHVGGWSRYQCLLLCFFFPFTLFLSYVAYSPILFLYVPDHWCHIHNLTSELEPLAYPITSDGKRSQCQMFDVDHQEMFSMGYRSANASWPVASCLQGYDYNFTGYFHSATSDMNWVCDESWKPAFTQSMFFVGGIIGTLFFGYAADHFGRLWALYSANGLLLVTGLATPFCQNFIAFVAIRFLMGLTHTTFFSVFFLLTLENVSIEKRSFIGNISLAIALTVGGVYQPWLLKYLQDWKIWHHALFVQVFFAIVPRGFIHESVRWLASEGRVEESVKVLKAIAKFNKKTVEPHIYKSFERLVVKEKSHETQKSWLDLFRTPRLRKNTILMVVTWMCISSMFDGHIRNISNLKYSIYWTFTISAALELPADLCTVWSLNAFGRRWSAFLSMTLSAIAMIVCGLNLHNIPLSTVFAMIGRFFITFAMNTGAQISFEVVPTELRGQGNALANVFALGAQFFSPYIVYSSQAWESLPFVILALGSLLGAMTALFLPETAGVDLPDTIEEAEDFGKHHTFFYVPILHKWKAKNEAKKEARRHLNIPQITFS